MKPAAESSVGLGNAVSVRWWVALLVGALLGLTIGLVLGRPSEPGRQDIESGPTTRGGLLEAASAPPGRGEEGPTRAGTAALRSALDAATAERALLSAELELLREEVDALRLALSIARESDSGAVAAAPGPAPPGVRPGPPAGHPAGEPWFDEAALLRAGLVGSDIERLRERWEQFELDKLYVADQAARRKAAGQPRQRNALSDAVSEFRTDVGDDGYDAYLYATGQPNRVVVGEVLQGSPAMLSGFEQGDLVLRYEGERILMPRELQRASRNGVEGEVVRVEVLRGESTISLTLPRGPLGIRMTTTRQPPEPY